VPVGDAGGLIFWRAVISDVFDFLVSLQRDNRNQNAILVEAVSGSFFRLGS
jgi:hypothetical protein